MSYVMPEFPAWLLYGTTLIYTIIFWCLAFILKQNPIRPSQFRWKTQKHYLILGFFTAMNGLLFQFSAAWVDGAISQVLANLVIVQLPFFGSIIFP